MCFVVKEEEYITPPIREKRVRRVDREFVEREQRRQSVAVPRRPPSIRNSRAFEETTRVSRVETRIPSRAPSRAPSRPRSTAPSEAPTARTNTRSHYIEVDHEAESSSSSGSSDEDVRSRTTHRTARTAKSSHTHRSPKAPSTAPTGPMSEYSMHEKEYRREYSRPRNDYETYRYVDAPPSARGSRSIHRDYDDDDRASRDSVHRRITIEEDRDGNRRRFEYRN